MKKDLISVVVPVYNYKNYIRKCIDSILNQTYSNTEIIIIDDGSTDNSEIIYNEYKNNKKLKIYKIRDNIHFLSPKMNKKV